MADGDHDHGHDHHDRHGHDHGDNGEEPDVSGWAAAASRTTCPACEASGALMLGGGIFCPACGAVSTSAGFAQKPSEEPTPES